MTDCNIASVLHVSAARLGDRNALTALAGREWKRWSFAELEQGCNGFAAALQARGVRAGDRVMLMVRPSMEFICLTFALFRLGAVVVLIDPGMGYRNLLRCIGSVRPDVLVGIGPALLFSRIFRRPFASLRKRIRVGPGLCGVGKGLQPLFVSASPPDFCAAADDLAAIIFTTGATGPPKGVEYTHGIFHAQLRMIRDDYGIGEGDVDQPGFPLFGLFAAALGARSVIPEMDPTRPARVDPVRFISTLLEHRVTYSFGSPAIWNVVSRYCLAHGIRMPVRKVLMAGAPVPGELVERMQRVLPPNAQIFTPYGATESLPVASIEGREIVGRTWPLTRIGHGVCVGRSLPGIDLRIIEPVAGPLADWREARVLPEGEIGEIVVRGPVVTRAYAQNESETRLAKIADAGAFWHRMGDMGYLDGEGRLWFCGRKAHRVATEAGMLYPVCCEAIFNEHPAVQRSALVGVGPWGRQTAVIVVEPVDKVREIEPLMAELRALAQANPVTASIGHFLLHASFPVDIRHNAKIFREQLAVWAARKLRSSGH